MIIYTYHIKLIAMIVSIIKKIINQVEVILWVLYQNVTKFINDLIRFLF